MKTRPTTRCYRWILPSIGIAIVLGLGCSSEPYKYVKVSGELKFEDGAIIQGESVTLVFKPQVAPIDDKTHPQDGIAYVSTEDGTFTSATSHEFEDGIVEGTHHVLVIATGPDGTSVVPTEYTDETTTPLVISTDDPQPFSFRVPKKE